MIYNTHRNHAKSCGGSFRDLAEYVEDAVRDLTPRLDDFDAIIVTGISGLALGAPLALRLNKTLAVVRKHSREEAHSCRTIEGKADLDGKRLLFVDDLVCSGDTRRNIERALQDTEVFDRSVGEFGEHRNISFSLAGQYLYRDREWSEWKKEVE